MVIYTGSPEVAARCRKQASRLSDSGAEDSSGHVEDECIKMYQYPVMLNGLLCSAVNIRPKFGRKFWRPKV